MSACDKVPLTSPTGSTITLAIDKSILPINGAAQVTAIVVESAGTAVQNGTVVSFTTTHGRLDPVEVKTLNGRASTMFYAGAVSGTAAINAFSGGATTRGSGTGTSQVPGSGVEVKIGNAAAGSVSVRAEPSTVPQSGGVVTLSALVHDTSGNPLPGSNIAFTTDQGSLASSAAISDADGIARTTLTTNRVAIVIATASGTLNGKVTINVITPPTLTIAATGTSFFVGTPAAFTVTPSVATTANPIVSVLVDFGDGQNQTLGAITGPIGLTHNYATHGGYTVTATARDISNQTGVSSVAVVVARTPLPTVLLSFNKNPIPTVDNGLSIITVTPGTVVTGGAPISSVVVKSNGTVIHSSTGGGTFSHQFGTFPGGTTYTVTATATDVLGNTATTSSVLVVQ